MKQAFLLFMLMISLGAAAQSKDQVSVLDNVRRLHLAVFGRKDSATLEKLFAPEVSYGHSSGKVETRAEAVAGILRNPSTYANLEMGPVHLNLHGKTAVSRHVMQATEKTVEGKENPLKLHIMMVWVKDGKDWKMMSRQAVRVP